MKDTRSAASTAVAKSAGEARPLGIAEHSASRELPLAKSAGEAGSSWSRTTCTTSAAAAAAAKSVGEDRPPGTARFSAASESKLAQSSDEAGSSWTRANGTTSATLEAKYADEARPHGIAKCSATQNVGVTVSL